MEYLVSQAEMKQYDENTITYYQIPALVLMERAALVSVEALRREKGAGSFRVLIAAGCGNNGGDGLAVGRLLSKQGCQVTFFMPDGLKKCSRETQSQLAIIEKYGGVIYDKIESYEYDVIVDALFGIGLSREVEGIYKDTIEQINKSHAYVCSLDIPSGVHTDTGQILGCAVRADLTVTYGFYKLGQFLYPGASYCGKVVCGQMGIDADSFLGKLPQYYTYTDLTDSRLPKRRADGNKGTFGKVLVIAGSDTIGGAALLAGESVLRSGAGMVKIVTAAENKDSILQRLPEAMLTVYDCAKWRQEEPEAVFAKAFLEALDWADSILIGSGIGTSHRAKWLLETCIEKSRLPMVIDADGLNLLAKKFVYEKEKRIFPEGRSIILTPHLGEFARLYPCTVMQAKEHLLEYPKQLADRLEAVVVCKDARTVVSAYDKKQQYINTAGNAGMATAGSGDVLAGIITGLLAQGMEAKEAAKAGVYLHAAAGDRAAKRLGERSMLAGDIIQEISILLQEAEKEEKRQENKCQK